MKTVIMFLILTCCFAISNSQNLQSFNWTTWNKLDVKIKDQLKLVKVDKSTSLYNEIQNHFKDDIAEEDISVATIDIDKDGKNEYAIAIQSSIWCGSAGCAFWFYKDGGRKQIHFTDEISEIRPAKNGVISSTGKLFTFTNVKL